MCTVIYPPVTVGIIACKGLVSRLGILDTIVGIVLGSAVRLISNAVAVIPSTCSLTKKVHPFGLTFRRSGISGSIAYEIILVGGKAP